MMNNVDGILLVDKPVGWTSRDVINKLNHYFHTKKIGHTGTLDPIASGVLIVCLGKYTKLVDFLTSEKKEYLAKVKLGCKTDTLDIEGKIVDKKEISKILNLQDILISFLGKNTQIIPLYSAKKINGKKLYEYARAGIDIDLPTKEVEIEKIELIEQEKDSFTFKTTVSKGTYIRSLIQDICEKTNNFGTMIELKRTKQGKFELANCFRLEEILKGEYKILQLNDLFSYPSYEVNEIQYEKIKNGNKLPINRKDPFLICTQNDKPIAVYQKDTSEYKMIFKLV